MTRYISLYKEVSDKRMQFTDALIVLMVHHSILWLKKGEKKKEKKFNELFQQYE